MLPQLGGVVAPRSRPFLTSRSQLPSQAGIKFFLVSQRCKANYVRERRMQEAWMTGNSRRHICYDHRWKFGLITNNVLEGPELPRGSAASRSETWSIHQSLADFLVERQVRRSFLAGMSCFELFAPSLE